MDPYEPVVRRVTIPRGKERNLFEALYKASGCTNAVEWRGKPPGAVQLSNVRGDLPHGLDQWEITFEFRPNPYFPALAGVYRSIDFEEELFGNWMSDDEAEADTPVIVHAGLTG